MSNEFYAKPIRWDKELQQITLQTKFMNPDQIQSVVDWIENGDSFIKVRISLIKKISKTYKQLCKYFSDINKILVKAEIDITKENVNSVDMELKKSVLDCEIKYIDKQPFIVVPSKANMSIEEMNFLIHKLQETYSFMNIDFGKIDD